LQLKEYIIMAFIATTEKNRSMQEILFDHNHETISRPL